MRTLAAFAVLLIVAACQAQPPEMTEAERAQIEAEVETYLAEFEEAWEALDLDRAFSLYVQTPEFTWAMNGTIMRGYDTNEEFARSFYSSIEAADWRVGDRHIAVLSRDVVVVAEVGTVVQTQTDGVAREYTYTYTYAIVRRDGEWKILLGHGAFVDN